MRVIESAQRNHWRVAFLGRLERPARTDIRAPGCYNSRAAPHVGSRLPPPLPAYCRGDGLCAARSRNCRPASCPCGDHAPGARASSSATCQSRLTAENLAATRCPGSIAGFSVSRPPLLRWYQCLPPGSARAGWQACTCTTQDGLATGRALIPPSHDITGRSVRSVQ
jgi:hypothetical protein